MMVFIIRSFGGEVCWEGEGSPIDEKDGGVTHHVCDRPMEVGPLYKLTNSVFQLRLLSSRRDLFVTKRRQELKTTELQASKP
jgi:hypothetical protein